MDNVLSGNLLVGQSGGPTSVINASLVGVIEEAKNHKEVQNIYGMRFGIEGFMEEKILDLSRESDDTIQMLKYTPGSALGSSRYKLQKEDFEPILNLFKKYNIRFFHMIGGNDTMDTIHRLTEYANAKGYVMRGVGIPKTVDNDLYGTDHTPGFASCARAIIISEMQSCIIARDMQRIDPILVTQTIGRDAGWLAAATALARRERGDGPHLIYLPERPLEWEKFKSDVKRVYKQYGWVSIVNGEGIVDVSGKPIAAGSAPVVRDKFGNVEFGSTGGISAARELFKVATETLGLRGEYQQPESQPLCMADRVSPLDTEEAYRCGVEAVRLAVRGASGIMVTIVRESDEPYRSSIGQIALKEVAIRNKKMPSEFIADSGNDVTEAFLKYMRPLIGDLPKYTHLKMHVL